MRAFLPAPLRKSHLVLAAGVLLKLSVTSVQPLQVITHSAYDDELWVKQAESLARGDWLGTYNLTTLMKSPFYSIWIGAVHAAHLPLLLAQQILYALACLAAVLAIRPVVRDGRARLLLFTLLLWNPVTFHGGNARVNNEGIYPAVTLLAFAGMIGCFARAREEAKVLLPWTALLGVATGVFWITREEGPWIVPAFAILWIAAAVRGLRRTDGRATRLALLASPLLVSAAMVALVAGINAAVYGAFLVVEPKSSEFKAAFGAITRVLPRESIARVTVPLELRRRLCGVSSAFASVAPTLEQRSGTWIAASRRALGEDFPEEIATGWFLWALREAVWYSGNAPQPKAAAAFYRRLASEINAACERGDIECGPRRASLLPPLRRFELVRMPQSLARGVRILATLAGLDPEVEGSTGPEFDPSFRTFRRMLRGRLSPAGSKRVRALAIGPRRGLGVTVRDLDHHPVLAVARVLPSDDVLQRLRSQGQHVSADGLARFEIDLAEDTPAELLFTRGGETLGVVPIQDRTGELRLGDTTVLIESVEPDHRDPPPSSIVHRACWRALRWVGLAYRLLLPLLLITSAVFIAVGGARALAQRTVPALFPIAAALATAIGTRLALLSFLDVTSFPALDLLYLAPLVPLLLLFCGAVIGNAFAVSGYAPTPDGAR